MIDGLTKLGKFFFAIPFLAFGCMHLMKGGDMAGMIPAWLPGGVLWVYLTGVAQLLFVVSLILGKMDKLASVLLALWLLISVLTIHVPGLSNPDQNMMMMSMKCLLKDLGLMGGALMFAGAYAKDKAVIG